MKFQLKLLALATLGLAATVPAHADIATNVANGELFLSVWDNNGTVDTADDRSYTRDLGSFMDTWASATTNPASLMASQTTAGYNLSFSADTLLGNWLAGSANQANLRWNVGAVDNVGTKRLLSTVSNLGSINLNTYASLRAAAGTANLYAIAVNGMMDATNSVAVNESTSVVGNVTSDASIGSVWNNNFGGKFAGSFNNAGAIGDSLGFYLFSETVASGSTTIAVKYNPFTSAVNNGTLLADGSAAKWTLNAAGDLSYSVAAAPAAVPVPAAVWLLGSGLVGMVGVARRKAA